MGIFDKLKNKPKKDDFGDLPPLPDFEEDNYDMPPMSAPQQRSDIEQDDMDSGAPPEPRQFQNYPDAPRLPEVPEPSVPISKDEEQVTLLTEDIEEIAEAIINDKWTEVTKEMDILRRELELANSNVDNLHNAVEKIESRLDDMQKAIFERMESYGKTMNDVNVELQAIDRVFRDVMPTFTENVKTLSEITSKKEEPTKKISTRKIKK